MGLTPESHQVSIVHRALREAHTALERAEAEATKLTEMGQEIPGMIERIAHLKEGTKIVADTAATTTPTPVAEPEPTISET